MGSSGHLARAIVLTSRSEELSAQVLHQVAEQRHKQQERTRSDGHQESTQDESISENYLYSQLEGQNFIKLNLLIKKIYRKYE